MTPSASKHPAASSPSQPWKMPCTQCWQEIPTITLSRHYHNCSAFNSGRNLWGDAFTGQPYNNADEFIKFLKTVNNEREFTIRFPDGDYRVITAWELIMNNRNLAKAQQDRSFQLGCSSIAELLFRYNELASRSTAETAADQAAPASQQHANAGLDSASPSAQHTERAVFDQAAPKQQGSAGIRSATYGAPLITQGPQVPQLGVTGQGFGTFQSLVSTPTTDSIPLQGRENTLEGFSDNAVPSRGYTPSLVQLEAQTWPATPGSLLAPPNPSRGWQWDQYASGGAGTSQNIISHDISAPSVDAIANTNIAPQENVHRSHNVVNNWVPQPGTDLATETYNPMSANSFGTPYRSSLTAHTDLNLSGYPAPANATFNPGDWLAFNPYHATNNQAPANMLLYQQQSYGNVAPNPDMVSYSATPTMPLPNAPNDRRRSASSQNAHYYGPGNLYRQ